MVRILLTPLCKRVAGPIPPRPVQASMEPSQVESLRQEVRTALQPVLVVGRKSIQASTCSANKKVKATGEYWIRRIMRAADEAVLKVKRAKKKHTSRASSSAAAPSPCVGMPSETTISTFLASEGVN